MTKTIEATLKESLIKIESVFMPGRLCDKREEMLRLQESGDTMFFDGDVKWSVILSDYDKKLNGESETLDAAFGDIVNCLRLLAKDHEEDIEILCAIEPAGAERRKS